MCALTVKVGRSTTLEEGSASSCASAEPARRAEAYRTEAALKRMIGDKFSKRELEGNAMRMRRKNAGRVGRSTRWSDIFGVPNGNGSSRQRKVSFTTISTKGSHGKHQKCHANDLNSMGVAPAKPQQRGAKGHLDMNKYGRYL